MERERNQPTDLADFHEITKTGLTKVSWEGEEGGPSEQEKMPKTWADENAHFGSSLFALHFYLKICKSKWKNLRLFGFLQALKLRNCLEIFLGSRLGAGAATLPICAQIKNEIHCCCEHECETKYAWAISKTPSPISLSKQASATAQWVFG